MGEMEYDKRRDYSTMKPIQVSGQTPQATGESTGSTHAFPLFLPVTALFFPLLSPRYSFFSLPLFLPFTLFSPPLPLPSSCTLSVTYEFDLEIRWTPLTVSAKASNPLLRRRLHPRLPPLPSLPPAPPPLLFLLLPPLPPLPPPPPLPPL